MADEIGWYTLLDGSHSFRGVRASKGQEILLTEKEAKRLGNRVRRLTMDERNEKVIETVKPTYTTETTVQSVVTNETTNNQTTNRTSSQPTRDWSTSQDMKATDLIAQVNETSSIPDLEVLYDLEEKGQNRVTVLREIEKRVNALDREGGQ